MIGEKIKELYSLREAKRELEKRVSFIEEQMKTVETSILAEMKLNNLTRAAGGPATVSVVESVKPTVKDWDAFYRFIHRNKYYHLLERRPSVAGCRELFETKGAIPGVEPFTLVSLRMVTSNSGNGEANQ